MHLGIDVLGVDVEGVVEVCGDVDFLLVVELGVEDEADLVVQFQLDVGVFDLDPLDLLGELLDEGAQGKLVSDGL